MKFFIMILSFLILSEQIFSQTNSITLQGVLKDSNGNKVNGTFEMTFNFYDSKDAETPIYAFTPSEKISVSNGIFKVDIDLGSTEIFKNYQKLWLGVKVENEPLFQKIPIVSVGYAIHSKYADSLLNPASDLSCNGCVEANDIADGSIQGIKIADKAVSDSKILSVSWAKITDIPQDIADGDNDTKYQAGEGLKLDETTFSLNDTYLKGNAYDSRFVNYGEKDSVTGDMIVDGSISFSDIGSNNCKAGEIIKYDGNNWKCSSFASGISGTGVKGYVPKFISSSEIGNSGIFELNGKIGIGTEKPLEKFYVLDGRIVHEEKSSTPYPNTWGKWAAIGNQNLSWHPDPKDYGVLINWDSDQLKLALRDYGKDRKDAIIGIHGGNSDDNIRFQINKDNDAMIITGTGKVGIGTTSPAKTLQVQATSSADGILISGAQDGGNLEWRTGAGYHWNIDQFGSTYDLRFFVEKDNDTSGGVKVIIKGNSGNVGVGTTNPSEKLEVSGNVKAANFIATNAPRMIGAKFADNKVSMGTIPVGWHYTPYTTSSSPLEIEVKVTSTSNVFLVVATQRWQTYTQCTQFWTGVRVLAGSSAKKFVHLDGIQQTSGAINDYGASGTAYISGLAPGTYKFRVENWVNCQTTRVFGNERYIVVYQIK